MFCKNCGAQLKDGICPNCQADLLPQNQPAAETISSSNIEVQQPNEESVAVNSAPTLTNNDMVNQINNLNEENVNINPVNNQNIFEEPPINNFNNNSMNSVDNTFKSNKKIYFSIAFLIIAVLLIAISTKLLIIKGPVELTTTAIAKFNNALFNEKDKTILSLLSNEYFSTENSSRMYQMINDADYADLKTNVNIKLPEMLKSNLGFSNFNYDMDFKKHQKDLIVDLDAKLDTNELLYLQGILSNKKFFLKLLKDSSNYYSLDFSEYLSDEKYSDIDITKFITIFNQTIKNNIKNSDFTKSSEKINVDGKEIKAKKYSLELTPALEEKLAKAYLENLKNDQDIIESLKAITNKSEADVKKMLTDAINDINTADKETIYYELYVKGSSLKKVTYGPKNAGIEITIGKKIIFDLSKTVKYPCTLTIENETMNFNAKKDDVSMDIKVEGKEDKKFSIEITNSKEKFNISGTYKVTEIKRDNEYKTSLNFELSVDVDNTKISIPITITINAKKISKFSMPDTSNAIDLKNITQEEQNTLINEITQMPIYNYIMGLAMGLINSNSTL